MRPTVRLYDIAGRHAASPHLLATYPPSRLPHEFFLWTDPKRRGRVLLYMSTPSATGDNLLATDISHARTNRFHEMASWTAHILDPANDVRLHPLSLSPDGRQAYPAYLGGGFLIAGTSERADAAPHPRVHLVTPVANRAHWGNRGAHNAVKLFGCPYVLVTEGVYATAAGPPVEAGAHGNGASYGCQRVRAAHVMANPPISKRVPAIRCKGQIDEAHSRQARP